MRATPMLVSLSGGKGSTNYTLPANLTGQPSLTLTLILNPIPAYTLHSPSTPTLTLNPSLNQARTNPSHYPNPIIIIIRAGVLVGVPLSAAGALGHQQVQRPRRRQHLLQHRHQVRSMTRTPILNPTPTPFLTPTLTPSLNKYSALDGGNISSTTAPRRPLTSPPNSEP